MRNLFQRRSDADKAELHWHWAFELVIAIFLVFEISSQSLTSAPVPDSIRWGGDETWLMREFMTQASQGVMRYPESYGTAPRADGVLAGSMWVEALLYGGAGNLFSPSNDLVSIGRGVTLVLSMVLLGVILWGLLRLGASKISALCAVLLLCANMSFFYASHSARYDILTGLSLLVWVLICHKMVVFDSPSRRSIYLYGAASVLVICTSRHMLTLALPVTLLTLYYRRIWRTDLDFPRYLIGAFLGAVTLVFAYWLGARELSLFGKGGGMGNYSFVLNQLPILRPFSRNVQMSNLMERVSLLWGEAPMLLLLIAAFILAAFVAVILPSRRRTGLVSNPNSFLLTSALFATLSWLLLQGARPYYMMHILPLLVFVSVLLLPELLGLRDKKEFSIALLVFAAIALVSALPSINVAGEIGREITSEQREAIGRFAKVIAGDHQGSTKPRVLSEVAGLNWMLANPAVDVITLDVFQPPTDASKLVAKLMNAKVQYAYLRSGPENSSFEPGRALLPHVLDSIGVVRSKGIGFFYDDDVTYRESLVFPTDTLTLYRLPESIDSIASLKQRSLNSSEPMTFELHCIEPIDSIFKWQMWDSIRKADTTARQPSNP